MNKTGNWLAALATAFSLVACYGTIAAIALLGMLGVTIALNEVIWAGAIILFAGLAVVALAIRWHEHRRRVLVLLAASGFVLIVFTMLVSYVRFIELLGFVFLFAGTVVDWRIGRRFAETDA